MDVSPITSIVITSNAPVEVIKAPFRKQAHLFTSAVVSTNFLEVFVKDFVPVVVIFDLFVVTVIQFKNIDIETDIFLARTNNGLALRM